MAVKQVYFVSSIIVSLYCPMAINAADAQIIPDSTTNTTVTENCADTCEITGGTLAGENLFHSFAEFGIRQGESIYFADPGVDNIFSRITGNNASQIFGTLGVAGDANLWLLNPNGIIFGEGSSLDLNGSFLATTADRIQFEDRGSFSAVANSQENLTLLTVNPDALFFNQMGQNGAIEVNNTLLSLPETETLNLIGKQPDRNIPGISLVDAKITIPQGNINLSSVANLGKVELNPNEQLEFSDGAIAGDISIAENSALDVSGIGGGSIKIRGKTISLREESKLLAYTLGNRDGDSIDINAVNFTITDRSEVVAATVGGGNSPDIAIKAEGIVRLKGNDIGAFQTFLLNTVLGGDRSNNSSSVIYTFSLGSGQAGDIVINSQNLAIENGAWILSSTIQDGTTGDIAIEATDNITIDGSGLIIGSALDSQGNVGKLRIDSQDLLLQNGGIISSSTLGSGSGGDINLSVTDSIHLRHSLPEGLSPTGIYSNTLRGEGQAGNLALNADSLILADGSQISATSGLTYSQGIIDSGGVGGNITLNVDDLILIQGVSSNQQFGSGIVNNTFSNNSAGDIVINTNRLKIANEGVISASTFGSGAGGNLTIDASEYLRLSGSGLASLEEYAIRGLGGNLEFQNLLGGLLTNTVDGEAGNTQITTPNLILTEGALISTSTFGKADGGNLNISANNIEVFSSLVASSTIGNGKAGNITIETAKLKTNRNGLITTSSGSFGNGGNLKIDATDSIELLDSTASLIIPNGIITTSIGLSYPGNLEINTKDLTIHQGASIAVNSQTNNPLVQDLIENTQIPAEFINSQPPRYGIINAESIDIAGFTGENIVSSISSTTSSAFPASNIQINTSKLSVRDRAEVSVSSVGKGKAGNLTIFADDLFLSNGGNFNATTLTGQGGNIELNVGNMLTLNDRATIRTDASGIGNGGNINIDSDFTILRENSSISANAELGQGGNIQISATDVFISPDSEITASASAEVGVDGEVEIETFNASDRDNLVKLPEKMLRADRQIVKSCGQSGKGVFSYVGRGGLPANPLGNYSLGDRILLPVLTNFAQSTSDRLSVVDRHSRDSFTRTSNSSEVEAFNWKINQRGKVELVAQTSADRFHLHHQCPFF